MNAPILNHHRDNLITRRSIFIGAAALLICAPAIVRATSLMQVRGLPLQFLNPLGEFYRRCFYHNLDFDLKTGRHARRHLQGRALRNPQSGASEAVDCQPARQGGLAVAAGGREGHDLRRIAFAFRARIFAWRRPIFHHAAGDRGDVRNNAADAGGYDLRSGRRYRWFRRTNHSLFSIIKISSASIVAQH